MIFNKIKYNLLEDLYIYFFKFPFVAKSIYLTMQLSIYGRSFITCRVTLTKIKFFIQLNKDTKTNFLVLLYLLIDKKVKLQSYLGVVLLLLRLVVLFLFYIVLYNNLKELQ